MKWMSLPVVMVACALSLAACGYAGSVSAGQTAVTDLKCAGCHGADFAGSTTPLRNTTAVYPKNLTPDKTTGIGTWTDAQIKAAFITGVDDEGATLCSKMPRFSTVTDTQAADIIAYLRSLPAVSKQIPDTTCP